MVGKTILIRKDPGENLTIIEDHFNKTFGSFRSKIENFEFPIEKKLIDIVVSNEKLNKNKLGKMLEYKIVFLNMDISDTPMIDNEYSDESNNDSSNSSDDYKKSKEFCQRIGKSKER